MAPSRTAPTPIAGSVAARMYHGKAVADFPPRAREREALLPPREERPQIAFEVREDRDQRPDVERDVERQTVHRIETDPVAQQHQMGGRGNREELRQRLNDAQHERAQKIQH